MTLPSNIESDEAATVSEATQGRFFLLHAVVRHPVTMGVLILSVIGYALVMGCDVDRSWRLINAGLLLLLPALLLYGALALRWSTR